MSIELKPDRSIIEYLRASLGTAADPGTAASFILHYSGNTVKFDGVIYGPDGGFRFIVVQGNMFSALEAAVQNTWLDSRDDQLTEPLSAVIKLNLESNQAKVEYHTGSDADKWIVTDDNFTELFESLTP